MPLRITTWNVNGIRNPFGYQPWSTKKTYDTMFDILEADIVIMQELKIQRKDLKDDMVLIDGWDCFFSLPRHKKGYSGVGIYTRKAKCAPIRAEEGLLGVLCPSNSDTQYCEMPEDQAIGGYPTLSQLHELGVDIDAKELDAEGRCVVVEFPAFVLFGIYSPANSNGLRDNFRYGFACAMDLRIRNLIRMGKRVIVTGDLNVSRGPMDTAGALDDMRKEDITLEQYVSTPNRRVFNQLIEGGHVVLPRDEDRENPVLWDICRGFHEDREGMYTHWEVKINARPANYGSRIDFVLCSLDMKTWFAESDIQNGLHGSDHCPVYAVVQDKVEIEGRLTNLLDVMNPPDMFRDGVRLRDITPQDTPPFSARLMPEFNNRRSIKDMFSKRIPSSQEKPPVASSTTPALTQSQTSDITNHEDDDPTSSQQTTTTANAPQRTTTKNTSSSLVSKPKKRLATTSSAQASKRAKSTALPPSTAPPKGQLSMRKFFSAKATSKSNNIATTESEESQDKRASPPPATPPAQSPISITMGNRSPGTPRKTPRRPLEKLEPSPSPTKPTPSQSPNDEKVVDPVAAKMSWDKLFTKKPPPRCESHNEPCQSFKVGKKGANQGREFWLCARPLGPSGEKERNTEWRCPTYIWASDWNSTPKP